MNSHNIISDPKQLMSIILSYVNSRGIRKPQFKFAWKKAWIFYFLKTMISDHFLHLIDMILIFLENLNGLFEF